MAMTARNALSNVMTRAAALDRAAAPHLFRMQTRARVTRQLARPVTGIVTRLGWAVLICALALWIVSWRLHWVELALIAAFCLVLLAFATLLTVGRTTLKVLVEVHPRRVVVGAPAAGRVGVTNVSRARLFSLALELPIASQAARFTLPSLRPGVEHEELFVVPTDRRGIIPIGPATTVRGDPFGLLRRAVAWTGVTELFVHPVTIAIPSLGSGLLRDLEGQPTNDLSMSDLAFNALREFAPGDDRRFIHWRSSAKAMGANPQAPFLVRQFLDTRRSQLLVLVDGQAASYKDPETFEVALEIGASIAVRAILDEMETTVVAGGQLADRQPAHLTLDSFSRAELNQPPLLQQTGEAVRKAPDTSLAFIVTGSQPAFTDLRLAASRFPPETRKIVIRVDPDGPLKIAAGTSQTVLSLPGLSDLPRALRGIALQ
jgi:uncharacterized protein (DUF58 family)